MKGTHSNNYEHPPTPPRGGRAWLLSLAIGGLLVSSGCNTVWPGRGGESLFGRSNRSEANIHYDERIEEVPSKLRNPAALSLSYATLMEKSGNFNEARDHYQKVLKKKPDDVAAITGLARVEQHLGNANAAEQGFKKALSLDANSSEALHGLGQVQATRQQWDDAVTTLNKAVLANPNAIAVRYDLAVAMVHNGNIDGSLPHFIRTVGDAEAHYNVGLILQQEGHVAQSADQFRLALAKKPTLAAARQHLEQLEQQQPRIQHVGFRSPHAITETGSAQHADYEKPVGDVVSMVAPAR